VKKWGITPATEVDFIEENGCVYMEKKIAGDAPREAAKWRGVATVKTTTDEIMALTRAN